MKIYLLFEYTYSFGELSDKLIGVYSSKKAALLAVAKFMGTSWHSVNKDSYFIQTHEVQD